MTGKRFGAIVARFLLLLLALCPVAVLAAAGQPHPAMWKIRNGASTVYVLGSLHIVPPDFQWRTPEIDAAVRATDTFVFAVPIDQQAIKHQKDFIIHNGLLPSGTSLRAVLSPAEFLTYARSLHGSGLHAEQFQRYRPWLAAVIVGLASWPPRGIAPLPAGDDIIIGHGQTQR